MLIKKIDYKCRFLVFTIFILVIESLILTSTSNATPTTMPNLVGKLGQAEMTWSKLGFTSKIKINQELPKNLKGYSCRAPLPTDLVISQDPVFNSPVTSDSQVSLTVICHLTTPQNSVVKKPYNPPRGKLRIVKKNQNSGKSSTPTNNAKTKIKNSKISCKKGSKIITLNSKVKTCPKGFTRT